MNWYKDTREYIENRFGENADLFCDILASTSPRKTIKANWNLALRIYNDFINGRSINYTGCLKHAHIPNINRALAGKELSGRKVQNFAKNLKGDLTVVTVDVWIARYFNCGSRVWGKTQDLIEMAIKTMALARQIQPAEMQAILWADSMRENGRKPYSYMDVIDDKQLLLWGG